MITVNAMGDNCPIPVIKTKKAMEAMTEPDTIEVLVDNEVAVQNVTKMAASEGGAVSSTKLGEGQYKVTIHLEQLPGKEAAAEGTSRGCGGGDLVIAVASDRMGDGDDALGKMLMKSFFFAVTQLDPLPKTVLFYNGGAKVSTEGSDSLEDLKLLESQGVEIMTCGTCLDHYGIKEKLAVGSVTNMYSIVDTLAKAGRIIRP